MLRFPSVMILLAGLGMAATSWAQELLVSDQQKVGSLESGFSAANTKVVSASRVPFRIGLVDQVNFVQHSTLLNDPDGTPPDYDVTCRIQTNSAENFFLFNLSLGEVSLSPDEAVLPTGDDGSFSIKLLSKIALVFNHQSRYGPFVISAPQYAKLSVDIVGWIEKGKAAIIGPSILMGSSRAIPEFFPAGAGSGHLDCANDQRLWIRSVRAEQALLSVHGDFVSFPSNVDTPLAASLFLKTSDGRVIVDERLRATGAVMFYESIP